MAVWWVASAVGLVVVIPLVLVLALRVLRPALEAARYADDILVHGVALSGTLDPVPALLRTRELVADVTAQAVRYAGAVERLT